MLRLFALLFLCLAAPLFPSVVQAACSGTDLRQHLSPQTAARLEQAVSAVPFAQGNHWIAQRGDQSIHVIGTMHLGDGRMHRVMRQLRPLILSSDLVFLEQLPTNTPDTPQDLIETFQHQFVMPRGKRLDQLLPAKSWEAVSLQARNMGIKREVAPFLQPWVYSMRLRSSTCGPRGLTSPRGLDERIRRFSLKRAIPLAALEQPGDGLRAFSGRPIKDQLRLLDLNLRNSFSDNDLAVTRREAYFDENLTEGWILSSWKRTEAAGKDSALLRRLDAQLNQRLHDQRNKAWMPVLRSRQEKTILVAVGAAHLPGRNGILNLLRRQGYSLSRAQFR